jgi:hypothetical protein
MILIPDPNTIGAVADWIELLLITTGELISKAKLSHLIEQGSGTEPDEPFIQDIWRELTKRNGLYARHPFIIDDLTVESAGGFSPKDPYIACLLLSLFGVQDQQTGITKLFERITARAVERYLAGEAVVFGWPVQDGSSPSIRQRVLDVSQRLAERFAEAPRESYKDRGVDVIGWKSFGEKRSGQLVILLQCAAGLAGRGKTTCLPLASWQQYIHWACDPIRAFAVPCIIPERDWHDISREGGIVFDRVRIINLLDDSSLDEELAEELRIWVETQLTELN